MYSTKSPSKIARASFLALGNRVQGCCSSSSRVHLTDTSASSAYVNNCWRAERTSSRHVRMSRNVRWLAPRIGATSALAWSERRFIGRSRRALSGMKTRSSLMWPSLARNTRFRSPVSCATLFEGRGTFALSFAWTERACASRPLRVRKSRNTGPLEKQIGAMHGLLLY